MLWRRGICHKQYKEERLAGLVTSCVGTEGKTEGRMEVTGRRGRRRQQFLDDLKDKWGYWKLNEETLDRTVWRIRLGRGCGPVVRQSTE
jgi:hypothetical protein